VTGQEFAELLVLIVCFFIAALASGTETALTSVGRLRVRHLAPQGGRAEAIFRRLGVPSGLRLWLTLLVSFGLSIILLIGAEVTPKTLAITNAERVALAAAGP